MNRYLFKTVVAWTSIVYAICFGGVALIPGIRDWFFQYALHSTFSGVGNVMTLGTFISGLVIWNVIVVAAVWLWKYLDGIIRV